jgi:hypothetical protein
VIIIYAFKYYLLSFKFKIINQRTLKAMHMNLEFLSYLVICLVTILSQKAHGIQDGPLCQEVEDENRFDCFPEFGANEADCVNRGCCWRTPKFDKMSKNKEPNKELASIPYCYYPHNFPNYEVVKKTKLKSGVSYLIQKQNATFRPNEILELSVVITFETSQTLRVQILDPNNKRYQVPEFSEDGFESNVEKDLDTDYQIYVHDSPFYVQIFRKSTGKMM